MAMAHKIIVTGKPVSRIRLVPELMDKTVNPNRVKVYSFELREEARSGAPKRLPKPSNVTFTIFVNDTQLKRNNLTVEELPDTVLAITGSITLKVKPLVPGHIGIVTLTIERKKAKWEASEEQKDQVPESLQSDYETAGQGSGGEIMEEQKVQEERKDPEEKQKTTRKRRTKVQEDVPEIQEQRPTRRRKSQKEEVEAQK